VFRKLREAVGGRIRHFVSGGGPLSPEINRFFFSAGIVILEGYGLTETSPVTNVNGPRDFPANYRIGTVGKPVPGTEERIAEDGEIVVRGPQVMKGYYNLPDQTAEVLTKDGWFRTGDIGEIDSEGFLRITDRKKDIIATAGGKKVAPQPIENLLKGNRYVEQPVLIGDRRKFVSLLVAPNFAALEAWARNEGIAAGDHRALLSEPRVQELLSKEIFSQLQHLSRFEMPKKILLLDRGFTVDDGSLTPSLKVKRRVVEERYRGAIDALYEDANESTTVFVA
jgi:long-chain acyl-CoA synthetase